MLEKTRVYRETYMKDLNRVLHPVSNTRMAKMTSEQRLQSLDDVYAHYERKWRCFKTEAETKAQKDCAEAMLLLIKERQYEMKITLLAWKNYDMV